jgi:hypothetical protein
MRYALLCGGRRSFQHRRQESGMLPRSVSCDECGKTAIVRGYGRVEYDWKQSGQIATTLEIKVARLTIDCPTCGVRIQDYWMAEPKKNES